MESTEELPETLGALKARGRELMAVLEPLNEQFKAAVTEKEKTRIRDQMTPSILMLEAVKRKARENEELTAIDLYLKACSPTHTPDMEPIGELPKTLEALQARRRELWAILTPLYLQREIAVTEIEKIFVVNQMRRIFVVLGAVMYKIKEYEQIAIAADHTKDSATGDQQESNTAIAAIHPDESPSAAAPANFSTSASLSENHLSTTSKDFEHKPEGLIDTNVQSDLTTVPPPASDTATSSHNTGMNGALAVEIDHVVDGLARLAEVVRNA